MEKHVIYQNQTSFVPEITVTKDQGALKGTFASLVSENDVANPPTFLKEYLSNPVFKEDLQNNSSAIVYGKSGDVIQKVIVFYTKNVDSKNGYKLGLSNQKKLSEVLSDSAKQNVTFYFSDSITQEYLNEYVYGLLFENYEWQRKSQPEGKQTNKKIYKPVKAYNFVSNVLNQNDPVFSYITKVVKYRLYCKELMNTRANIATTLWMRDQAKSIQEANSSKVDIEIIQGEELLNKGLRLMHAVGRASISDPTLVVLNYRGNPDKPDDKYALVGKGIVYDCGGLNLKMALTEIMHTDKGGACACLAVFRGVVELGLKINLVCTLGLCENFISNNAYRPSDIIETYKGITVEIINTDAEGRNVLADALSYTQVNYKPHTVFDIATLTGACMIALGLDHAAILGNDEELQREMIDLSKTAYEPLHNLPITDYMRDNIVSDQGDIRNSGKERFGGTGTAAAFLENFIEEGIKWAHFDIATSCPTKSKTATVRTLIDYYKKQIGAQ